MDAVSKYCIQAVPVHFSGTALGMFGDTMQKIYNDGKDNLAKCIPDNWVKPVKIMNHRSAKRIVTLANSIRSSVDDQKQQARSDAEEGTVRLFITSKSNNKEYVEKRVAEMMVQDTGDIGWNDEEDYKSLILEHHMAASRFGFSELYMPLSNSKKFDTSLREGSIPELSILSKLVFPLLVAYQSGNDFEVAKIIRKNSPLLNKEIFITGLNNQVELLRKAEEAVELLMKLWNDGKVPTCLEVLKSIRDTGLFKVGNRVDEVLADYSQDENEKIIGSPAVCLYRNLKEIVDLEERKKIARECCDKSFVSMFNRPESRSIMDAVFEGKKGSSDEKHYEQVFHYCVDGNFQSMLDEYKFALGVCGEEFVEAIKDAFLQTTTLPYVSQEYYRASFTDRPQSKAPRLRVHFAAGYFDAKTSDKTIQRVNNVRNAFNSPFRPFVLATTSVGQEGLDFHLYSRKVVHWNLPSNPIDLEQREGRINRYMCHAIRQNVGANESAFDWKEKFDKTKEKYGKGTSDMIPYWCLPDEYPFKYQIERIVPMYPFGQDKTKYDRLINVLALYRLTLGQPRQEEMIAILQREDLSKEQMEELFFDLSPYSRNKKKQTLQW